jgi:hypothetical protein
MTRSLITEAQIRRIIQEEVTLKVLEEGMWDDVRNGAIKLKTIATKQFGKAASKWGQAIQKKIGNLKVPDEINVALKAINVGMRESGESLHLDDTLQAAKELGSITKDQALAATQADFEGPVHDLALTVQSSGSKVESKHYAAIYSVLLETPVMTQGLVTEFGLSGTLGVGLAVLGGLPMLFAGLHKLAKVLHAEKLAHLFHKAEHLTHALEVKVINTVVPNKLSYFAYKFLHNKGLRFSDEKKDHLEFDEYVNDVDGSHAMKRVNGLLYKALLIYFAFNGLASVLHAGASLIGFVEGAATTVKGVELARGAMEIAALTSKTV